MATDPRIGTEVAGYRIERLLGRGGMGVVYLAEHLRLNRRVALKLLAPEIAQDPNFRERFVRESQLAASLEHPNIIPIYDAGEEGDFLYIAMRYVEGTDLKTVILEEGALSPERVLPILAQAAAALDTAHARGLVHRDVKPGNILLSSEAGSRDHAYLSDFGLTKRMTSDSGLTGTGQFVGTLDYAAPEQFEGKQLDGRADVYSLGGVLYECLTGEIPFRRDNQAALVYAHLMADPPSASAKRPELPVALDAVVSKAMAKSPEDRYPTAGALVADARNALGDKASETAGGTSPPLTVPTSPPTVRPTLTPARIAVGGLLISALVVGAVVLFAGGTKGKAKQSPSGAAPAAAIGDRVVRIDIATKKVLMSIPVGKSPSGVAIGEGSVWVTSSDEGVVYRIDPVSNKVEAKIPVGKRPWAIASGNDAIWVANRLSNSASEIDPGTNHAITISGVGNQPQSIAAGDGAVFVGWGYSGAPGGLPGGISIIDPGAKAVIKTVGVATQCAAVVAEAAGTAWAGGTNGELEEIDAATGAVGRTITLGTAIAGLSLGEGALWVARDGLPAAISRLNPDTGKVEATIPVGSTEHGACETPISLTATQGFVWVTNADDGTVSQITAVSNHVGNEFDVGKTPTGVAVGFGSAWVTVDAP